MGMSAPVDKPTYTADEVGARPDTWTPSAADVGALPNDTEIPSKTSDLENDSGFITNSDIPEKLPNPQKIILLVLFLLNTMAVRNRRLIFLRVGDLNPMNSQSCQIHSWVAEKL